MTDVAFCLLSYEPYHDHAVIGRPHDHHTNVGSGRLKGWSQNRVSQMSKTHQDEWMHDEFPTGCLIRVPCSFLQFPRDPG